MKRTGNLSVADPPVENRECGSHPKTPSPFYQKIIPGGIEVRVPFDLPVLTLIAANLITIVIAVLQHWDLGQTLFIYWVQSLIIGLFAVARLISFPTDLLAKSPALEKAFAGTGEIGPARAATLGKYFLAGFFSLHYGLFHYGYYEFLTFFGLLAGVSLADPFVLLACGGFFAHHAYSFSFHRQYTAPAGEYLKETFTYPYHRIIPLHATILFGGFISMIALFFSVDLSAVILVFFLGVKTVVDVRAHIRKHREEGDNPPVPARSAGH